MALRFTRQWGPRRDGYHLHLPHSTVGRVLVRYRMPLLVHLDQATGLPVRRSNPDRYEVERLGELVDLDIKKLGPIPDGGGHRVLGRQIGIRNNKQHGRGYAHLHHAGDDHSRMAYSEILGDEGSFRRERAVEALDLCTVGRNQRRVRAATYGDARALGRAKHRRTRRYLAPSPR